MRKVKSKPRTLDIMVRGKEIISSIIKTLVYSDIFVCPLKFNEIFKYYNGPTSISRKDLDKILKLMVDSGQIQKLNSLYFLPGRKSIVEAFMLRRRESKKKLKIAARAVGVLKKIPTIKLIGVSGSLAVNNSKKNDDIDLFFITSRNTLWITRFIVNIILIIYGGKRDRADFLGADKICPNMYISEEAESVSLERRNLFCAREITQLLVLFEKNDSNKHFLFQNKWVLKFLPNTKILNKMDSFADPPNGIVRIIDRIFFAAQFLYMSGRITKEEVRPGIARFHPDDCTFTILELFNQRCKIYLEPSDAFDPDLIGVDTFASDTPGY